MSELTECPYCEGEVYEKEFWYKYGHKRDSLTWCRDCDRCLEGVDIKAEEDPECPVCGSPLEDNGNCSDVGNNNCFYTGGMG